jgi:hypothetical protein
MPSDDLSDGKVAYTVAQPGRDDMSPHTVNWSSGEPHHVVLWHGIDVSPTDSSNQRRVAARRGLRRLIDFHKLVHHRP